MVLTIVLLCGLCQGAPRPAPLNIPESERRSGLSNASIKQIEDWLTYYADVIRDAKSDPSDPAAKSAQILRGRDGLVEIYETFDEAVYRREVARRVVKIVSPLLALRDPQKQINAAMAMSKIARATIQPGLERMIVNPNAAVRYLGWKGYRNIRTMMLIQSAPLRRAMFNSLKARAAAENSAPVIRAMLSFMVFPPIHPDTVTKERYFESWRRGFSIIGANWKRWCVRVVKGDAEMSKAMRRGADVVRRAKIMTAAEAKSQAKLLSMLMDLTWAAGVAYNNAMTPIERAKARIVAEEDSASRDQAEIARLQPLADANMMLLRDCEDALNELKGLESDKRVTKIKSALTSGRVKRRGAAVMVAVATWAELLAADGVKNAEQSWATYDTTVVAPATAPAE